VGIHGEACQQVQGRDGLTYSMGRFKFGCVSRIPVNAVAQSRDQAKAIIYSLHGLTIHPSMEFYVIFPWTGGALVPTPSQRPVSTWRRASTGRHSTPMDSIASSRYSSHRGREYSPDWPSGELARMPLSQHEISHLRFQCGTRSTTKVRRPN
jgi:hypothetical protein